MLDPNFVANLSSDCLTMGLKGCFEKNGQLEPETLTSAIPGGPTVHVPSSSATEQVTVAVVVTQTPTGNSPLSSVIGAASTGTDTTGAGTSTSTSTSTASSEIISQGGGLSTGAKAGIGAGIGILVLLTALGVGFFLLKRRKQKRHDVGVGEATAPSYAPEKTPYNDPHQRGLAELQAHDGPYGTAELASPEGGKFGDAVPQQQIYEIDGSSRYKN